MAKYFLSDIVDDVMGLYPQFHADNRTLIASRAWARKAVYEILKEGFEPEEVITVLELRNRTPMESSEVQRASEFVWEEF